MFYGLLVMIDVKKESVDFGHTVGGINPRPALGMRLCPVPQGWAAQKPSFKTNMRRLNQRQTNGTAPSRSVRICPSVLVYRLKA